MNLRAAAGRAAFLVLLPEAIAACVWFRWRLYRDAAGTLRAAAPPLADCPRPGAAAVSDVSRAVYLAKSLVPGTLCLPQSLAVRRMLARRGCPCRLDVGVSLAGGFHAHAWVTDESGAVIHGKIEESFHRLSSAGGQATR